MASNRFGRTFQFTTWGESHGAAMGVVIDGCPPGVAVNEEMIQEELEWRRPGRNSLVSPRGETDQVEILSGVLEGKSTGAPIGMLIRNRDSDSSKYDALKDVWRPGHANFTWEKKYGVFDHRGGGRASARETVCRVAAGAVAKEVLRERGIEVVAWLEKVGEVSGSGSWSQKEVRESGIFCPGGGAEAVALLERVKEEGDSVGGVVCCEVRGCPAGVGDPVYEKVEARLAYAMLGLPASKGFEIGEGFGAASMPGSEHNDPFDGVSNHAGGVLGGVTTGLPIRFRVAFKPTSSIFKRQKSLNRDGEEVEVTLPKGSRHDPCVAVRAVPVVEAMGALVMADFIVSDGNR